MLSAIPYYGGKSANARGTCQWINTLLPNERDYLYHEPFFGMGGVLLSRQPAKFEIVNDLNDRLINWWRIVRDNPLELGYLIERTPRSRKEYEWSLENLDNLNLSPLRRALAFFVVLSQGLLHADGNSTGKWAMTRNPRGRLNSLLGYGRHRPLATEDAQGAN